MRCQNLGIRLLLRQISTTSTSTLSPSAILNPSDPSVILSAKQKSRAALRLLKSETEPSRIIDICRAAALTPVSHLDRNAFSSAISKLSSFQSFSSIRTLVDDLLLSPKNQDPRYLSHAVVLFGQAGMLDDAIRAFRTLPSTRSFNALLFACIISNNHAELAKIFREYPAMYGVSPDVETYNFVIKSFEESGTSRSFFSVFDEMLRKKISPNTTTFCNALKGFYQEQKFEDVEKVLDLMKRHDCNPGVSTYNVRILGLTKLGRSEQAKELFKEMVKKNMKPTWVSYSYLIVGFCKEGNLEEAMKLYKSMHGNGCTAESWVYFSLINHLCKAGDFEAALQICKETMAKNWVPSFAIMKTLVNGLASSSKVDDARDIIEKVKEKFPNCAVMWKEVEESLSK